VGVREHVASLLVEHFPGKIGAGMLEGPGPPVVERSRNDLSAHDEGGILAVEPVRIDGFEHLQRANDEGHGVLICGFHFGSFSLIPFALSRLGCSLTVFLRTERGLTFAKLENSGEMKKCTNFFDALLIRSGSIDNKAFPFRELPMPD